MAFLYSIPPYTMLRMTREFHPSLPEREPRLLLDMNDPYFLTAFSSERNYFRPSIENNESVNLMAAGAGFSSSASNYSVSSTENNELVNLMTAGGRGNKQQNYYKIHDEANKWWMLKSKDELVAKLIQSNRNYTAKSFEIVCYERQKDENKLPVTLKLVQMDGQGKDVGRYLFANQHCQLDLENKKDDATEKYMFIIHFLPNGKIRFESSLYPGMYISTTKGNTSEVNLSCLDKDQKIFEFAADKIIDCDPPLKQVQGVQHEKSNYHNFKIYIIEPDRLAIELIKGILFKLENTPEIQKLLYIHEPSSFSPTEDDFRRFDDKLRYELIHPRFPNPKFGDSDRNWSMQLGNQNFSEIGKIMRYSH